MQTTPALRVARHRRPVGRNRTRPRTTPALQQSPDEPRVRITSLGRGVLSMAEARELREYLAACHHAGRILEPRPAF